MVDSNALAFHHAVRLPNDSQRVTQEQGICDPKLGGDFDCADQGQPFCVQTGSRAKVALEVAASPDDHGGFHPDWQGATAAVEIDFYAG